jgi:hypothetical protein
MPAPELPQGVIDKAVQSHVGVAILIGSSDVGSGRIQSFNDDQGFNQQAVHGVGDFLPVEHTPLKFDGTLTLDAFRIRLKDLNSLGVGALGLQILALGVLRIQLYDKIDKRVFRTYEGVSVDRQSLRVQEGAIVGENVTTKYLNVR